MRGVGSKNLRLLQNPYFIHEIANTFMEIGKGQKLVFTLEHFGPYGIEGRAGHSACKS